MRTTATVISLALALLLAGSVSILAQEASAKPSKKDAAARAAARQVEIEVTDALADDWTAALGELEREPSARSGEELDKVYGAIAKARTHSPHGKCALEICYQVWANPTGKPPTWDATLNLLSAWRKHRPDSAPASIATARAYIGYAWASRGSGFALTVSDENFKLFHERIAEARNHLEAAEKKTGVDVELYRLLIDVCKADDAPADEAAKWFKKAQLLDPTYSPVYQAMAESLMPRWGGGKDDQTRFATEVLTSLEGDEGKMIHARVVGTLCMYGHREYLDFKHNRMRVLEGSKLLAELYPESIWCQNLAAMVGMHFADRELCRQALPVVEKDQILPLWGSKQNCDLYLRLMRENRQIPQPSSSAAQRVVQFLGASNQVATVGGKPKATVLLWDDKGSDPRSLHSLPTKYAAAFGTTADGKTFFHVYGLDQIGQTEAVLISAEGKEVRTLSDPKITGFHGGCISADGKYCATLGGSPSQIQFVAVWNAADGKLLEKLEFKDKRFTLLGAEFSPDGNFVVATAGGATIIWNWERKEEVLNIRAGQDGVKLGGDYTAPIFVGFRGEHEAVFYGYSNSKAEYHFVAWRPEGKTLITLLRTKESGLEAFRVAADGRFVAATLITPNDGLKSSLQVWDLKTGNRIADFSLPLRVGRQQFALSSDGSHLAYSTLFPPGFEVIDLATLHQNAPPMKTTQQNP